MAVCEMPWSEGVFLIAAVLMPGAVLSNGAESFSLLRKSFAFAEFDRFAEGSENHGSKEGDHVHIYPLPSHEGKHSRSAPSSPWVRMVMNRGIMCSTPWLLWMPFWRAGVFYV